MEWTALFSVIQSWGPTAISSTLVIVVVYLIKKIDANSERDARHAQELRDYINNALNNFGTRLSTIERDYTKNDFFYRELSGWKTEINRLSDQMTANFTVLIQHIIEVLTKGKP